MTATAHPAKFHRRVLDAAAKHVTPGALVLDPFAGVGLVHELEAHTIGLELEYEWASQGTPSVVGDALALPFPDATFDAVVTSPTYGNRMADHHHARDGSLRYSYTHTLGRSLHPNNSGTLHWGAEYQRFHSLAWREVWRVVRPGGRFVLNIKDHVRAHERQRVAAWHVVECIGIGFELYACTPVVIAGLRVGANRERIGYELVITFERVP